MKIAVIGFGRAGYEAAKAVRQADPNAEIHVYNKDGEATGNPMLTSYFAEKRIDEQGLYPFGPLDEITRELSLVMHSAPVEHLFCDTRTVRCGGTENAYDRVILATGAVPVVPRSILAPGYDPFVLRTYGDMRRMIAYLDSHDVKSAVVVGASWVGIKVTELLHTRGIHVTMLDAADRIFPSACYPDVAQTIHKYLENLGIALRFGVGVTQVREGAVTLADGTALPSGFTCLSVGIRPDIAVIEGENVKTGRGIIVDEHMQTSAPGIYAAGDCCEVYNPQTGGWNTIGLWAAAGAQGQCAGQNAAGVPCVYSGEPPHNITHFFDLDFAGMGDIRLEGRRVSFPAGDIGRIEVTVNAAGKLLSVNILQNYRISGFLKNHLLKQIWGAPAELSAQQAGRLKAEGVSPEFIEFMGGNDL